MAVPAFFPADDTLADGAGVPANASIVNSTLESSSGAGGEGLLADPVPPNWPALTLADAWPDRLQPLTRPRNALALLRHLLGKRKPVELPEGLLAAETIPKYVLQEFHHLPNGNYSNHLSHGYITGFDLVMLGQVEHSRQWISRQLQGCEAVLDIGTAGGKTAAAVSAAGGRDVWGMDPSPYLLRHAASRYPHIRFIPGVGEQLPFAEQRFDAISLCFVLHEVPPKYARQILQECYRCLKPGGLLAIAEPSARQYQRPRLRSLLSAAGWKHLYFYLVAHQVYEPFLEAWHKIDKVQWLTEGGFALQNQLDQIPISHWLARKA